MSVNEKMTAIADNIRSKTNGKDALTLDDMANGVNEVYETGKDSSLRDMWEAIQCGGKREHYTYLLQYTSYTKKTFKPLYDIKLTGNMGYNWSHNMYPQGRASLLTEGQVNMKELEEEQGMSFDFSECTNCDRLFSGGLFNELNLIDLSSATALNFTFYGGYVSTPLLIKRIEHLICSETTAFATNTFQYASGLTYIGFEGVIGTSINLSWSPLVPESMKKAILCLKNYAGTDNEFVNTIKFSDDCWATLEADSTAPDGNTWQVYVGTLGWNT